MLAAQDARDLEQASSVCLKWAAFCASIRTEFDDVLERLVKRAAERGNREICLTKLCTAFIKRFGKYAGKESLARYRAASTEFQVQCIKRLIGYDGLLVLGYTLRQDKDGMFLSWRRY